MKHVGMNVASDALMTLTLTGVVGGLVIAVADDVGLSSSQNEQDSRYWGRFAHLPMFEPSDSQEAYEMTKAAYDFSERFQVPVILRMTTRINHVKGLVSVGERVAHAAAGFKKEPARWVMTPAGAGKRIPLMFERDKALRAETEISPLNTIENGKDKRVGFVTSGPAYMHVRESFPDAPVLKLGFSCPVPTDKIRAFAATVETLVVVEEVEPLVELELKAAGIQCLGKEILPRQGELAPNVLKPAIARLLGEPVPEMPSQPRRSSRGHRPCAWPARTSASITRWRRSRTSPSPATSAATRWAPAIPGTRWTPRSRWAPRWASRWASTRAAATPTRTSASSP
jgi:indolepyruvate ferredoxin oxidoreductase alpha subunit